MTTTENNVAAQAGDEPMRAVVALAWKWHDEAVADGFAASEPAQELFELLGWPDRAVQVSPRATADVERDADDEASRGSIEDFVAAADLVDAINACETKGEALGLVLMYRKAIRLATTKPGA